MCCLSLFYPGPSRIRHGSSKDTPDAGSLPVTDTSFSSVPKDSHPTTLATMMNTTSRDRPISMHELSSRLSNYEKSSSTTSSPATPSTVRSYETINPPGEAVRGDPDGCGLDPVTSFCSPLPDRRSSTLTLSTSSSPLSTAPLVIDGDGLKKGWLLRLAYG